MILLSSVCLLKYLNVPQGEINASCEIRFTKTLATPHASKA